MKDQVKVRIQGDATIKIDQTVTISRDDFDELSALSSYHFFQKIQSGMTGFDLEIGDGDIVDFDLEEFELVPTKGKSS